MYNDACEISKQYYLTHDQIIPIINLFKQSMYTHLQYTQSYMHTILIPFVWWYKKLLTDYNRLSICRGTI